MIFSEKSKFFATSAEFNAVKSIRVNMFNVPPEKFCKERITGFKIGDNFLKIDGCAVRNAPQSIKNHIMRIV